MPAHTDITPRPMRWTDDEILTALHLADHAGWSFSQIGEHLGRSRNSVAGAIKRARDAIYVSELRRSLPMWWKP